MAYRRFSDSYHINVILKKNEIVTIESFLAKYARETQSAFLLKFYGDFLEAYTKTTPTRSLLGNTWGFRADEKPLAVCIYSVLNALSLNEADGLDIRGSEEHKFLRCWQHGVKRASEQKGYSPHQPKYIPNNFYEWETLTRLNKTTLELSVNAYLRDGTAFHLFEHHKDKFKW